MADEVKAQYARAAAALLDADFLLVCAGAGFSADSGLPVYKDVADIEPYRQRSLTYSDLCTPGWCQRDPETFYGFWGACYNSYFDTEPHEGYSIINRWRDGVVGRRLVKRISSARSTRDVKHLHSEPISGGDETSASGDGPSAGFVFTSNVDCFFRRAGWAETQILEIHGNVQRWQCSLPCSQSRLSRQPVWLLPKSHRFELDMSTMRAPRFYRDATNSRSDGPSEAEHEAVPNAAAAVSNATAAVSAHATRNSKLTTTWDGEEEEEEEEDDDDDDGDLDLEVYENAGESDVYGKDTSGASERAEDVHTEDVHCRSCADMSDTSLAVGTSSDTRRPRLNPDENFVHCPHCGRLARPCILMFDDNAWMGDEAPGPLGPGHSQPRCYRQWEAAVKAALKADRRKRLVILELGCGLRVPTVRRHAERLLKQTIKYNTQLVRINLDEPEARKHGKLAGAIISLRSTCLAALQQVDSHINEACAIRGVPTNGGLYASVPPRASADAVRTQSESSVERRSRPQTAAPLTAPSSARAANTASAAIPPVFEAPSVTAASIGGLIQVLPAVSCMPAAKMAAAVAHSCRPPPTLPARASDKESSTAAVVAPASDSGTASAAFAPVAADTVTVQTPGAQAVSASTMAMMASAAEVIAAMAPSAAMEGHAHPTTTTTTTTTTTPAASLAQSSLPLPSGWSRYIDPASGRPYFADPAETTWDFPRLTTSATATSSSSSENASEPGSPIMAASTVATPASVTEAARSASAGTASASVRRAIRPCTTSHIFAPESSSGNEDAEGTSDPATAGSARPPASTMADGLVAQVERHFDGMASYVPSVATRVSGECSLIYARLAAIRVETEVRAHAKLLAARAHELAVAEASAKASAKARAEARAEPEARAEAREWMGNWMRSNVRAEASVEYRAEARLEPRDADKVREHPAREPSRGEAQPEPRVADLAREPRARGHLPPSLSWASASQQLDRLGPGLVSSQFCLSTDGASQQLETESCGVPAPSLLAPIPFTPIPCTPPPALASAAAYLLAAQRRSAPRVYTKASKSMLPYERSLQASKILVPFERARTGISLGTRVSTTNVAVRDKPTALHNGFFTSVHQAVALRDGGNVGSAKPLQTVAIEPPHPLSSPWAAIRPNSGVGVRPSTTGASRPFTPTAPVPYRLQLALPGARTAAASAASQGRVQPPPL